MKTFSAVVTGGAGFIGSHLVDELMKNNNKIKVIDNLSSGRIKNISKHLKKKNFSFYKLDLSNYSNSKKLTKIFTKVDYVFHLAALADIVPSIKKPIEYFRANVDSTLNVLEASRENNNLKRFVYIASSSCYGIPDKYPTSEDERIDPKYPYALTKYLGEQLALHWNKIYNIPATSLRLFNVYGPRARTTGAYGAVFGVFLAQKLHSKPLTIVGDGTQTRDFTYVDDVIKGIIKATHVEDAIGEVFNIGSGNTYSINYLAELIGGKKVRIPERPREPDKTFADISKAKSILGYQPEISFEQGVKMMIEKINDWKKAPVWTKRKIKKQTKLWFRYLN